MVRALRIQSLPKSPTSEHRCTGDQIFNTTVFGRHSRSKSKQSHCCSCFSLENLLNHCLKKLNPYHMWFPQWFSSFSQLTRNSNSCLNVYSWPRSDELNLYNLPDLLNCNNRFARVYGSQGVNIEQIFSYSQEEHTHPKVNENTNV